MFGVFHRRDISMFFIFYISFILTNSENFVWLQRDKQTHIILGEIL